MRTVRLRVPSPALPKRLDRFLASNLHGLSRKQVKKLIDAGQVRVDGRRERKANLPLTPGRSVEIDYRPSMLPPVPVTPDRVLMEGPGWLAVDKPPGICTHRADDGAQGVPEALGEALGLAPEDLRPVHRLDRGTSGALLLARSDDAAAALSGLFATRAVQKVYRAVVRPAPEEDSGREIGEGMELSWTVLRRSADGSRAELAVHPLQGRTHQVRIQLAAAGTPIVGDLEHGAPCPGGSPRLALHCERMSWAEATVAAPIPERWEELLEPPDHDDPPPLERRRAPCGGKLRRTLRVSRATARILRSGHPWVIRDGDTGDLNQFEAGQLADLVDPQGAFVATALVDPTRPVCARVVSTRRGAEFDAARRVSRSIERRRALLDDPTTTALRLVHGEADGLPGLALDLWDDLVVVTRTAPLARAFEAGLVSTVSAALGDIRIHQRDHFEDLRATGSSPRDARLPGSWLEGSDGPDRCTVRERGLRYEVEPLAGLTTGLYPDQRTNRDRLVQLVRDADRPPRIANLFAHTGAFSVACAAAGAESAISVDPAPRYCEWTRKNLLLNGLDPARHPAVPADSLAWLREQREPLDGLVIDPPAFARGRSRGVDWSARRDYRALVEAAAGRLAPGGWMLCCINVGGLPRGWLRRELEAGLRAAGRRLARSEPAPPAPDHPRQKGFPEGVAFSGILAWTDE